jgi:hypothetical protein
VRHTLSLLALGASVVTGAGSARAVHTSWWLLNGESAACVDDVRAARDFGVPAPLTPYRFEAQARARFDYHGMNIIRDGYGSIRAVSIILNHDVHIWFLPGPRGLRAHGERNAGRRAVGN